MRPGEYDWHRRNTGSVDNTGNTGNTGSTGSTSNTGNTGSAGLGNDETETLHASDYLCWQFDTVTAVIPVSYGMAIKAEVYMHTVTQSHSDTVTHLQYHMVGW